MTCKFCPEPEKLTEWHYEDDICRVIDKPTGEPMVLINRHTDELTEDERNHITDVLDDLFVDYDLRVLMNHVRNHWHAHIINYEWQ